MPTDMLVDVRHFTARPSATNRPAEGVEVRRAGLADKESVSAFVLSEFDEVWSRGVPVAYERKPASIFVARDRADIIGFALYDIAFLGYFGPIGVREQNRDHGVGEQLLVAALEDMRIKGYAYAVIGDVGPVEFYEKTCRARVIVK